MADPWELAKRVIIWNAELPPDARPADATSVLLSRIVPAREADVPAKIDRFCRHAMRDAANGVTNSIMTCSICDSAWDAEVRY